MMDDHHSSSSRRTYGSLALHSVPLVGRQEELQRMQDAYEKAADHKNRESSSILVIEGQSGTGKSALVKEAFARHNREKRDNVFWCRGKFDNTLQTTTNTTEPFVALKQAFAELLERILGCPSLVKKGICSSIQEVVADEQSRRVLGDIVPGLETLLLLGQKQEQQQEKPLRRWSGTESQKALNRLKYLATEFFKAVSAHGLLVFFLDDLQWADTSTLDLLESILQAAGTEQLEQFLFVGTHRPVDKQHPLREKLDKLQSHIIPIHLEALSITDVDQIVQHCTRLEKQTTLPLSEIVHRKTQGNALFVLEYIQLLARQDLLTFSTVTFQWTFDAKQIDAKTCLADSIADVVGSRIRHVPQIVQTILKLSACLWTQFRMEQLWGVLKELNLDELTNNAITDEQQLAKTLEVAVENGFLDQLSDRRYKFSHDRIRESAYGLFQDQEQANKMHLMLGRTILSVHKREPSWNDKEARRPMLFTCVDQLNKGSKYIDDEEEALELASLNLEAGQTAKTMSAFVPAKNYLKAGIGLLPRGSCWDTHYQLTLSLFSNFAEMTTCLGNFNNESDQIADEVLRCAKVVTDKLPVYRTKVDAFAQQNQFQDAVSTAQTALRELGEPMPKKANMVQVLVDLFKTKRMLNGKTDEDILNLPLVQDKSKVAAMEFLNYYAAHSLFLERTADMLLCMLRNVQLTVKHGLSKLSASAISQYGIVIGSMGNAQEAYRLGSIAVRLLDKLDAREYEAYCLQVAHAFEIHLRESFYSCLEPLQKAYQKGMMAGDTELAFYGAATYVMMYVWSGLYLEAAEKDCRLYCQQMLQYGREDNYAVGCTVWQFLLNITGIDRPDNPTQMIGTAMIEEDFVEKYSTSKNAGALQSFWLFKAQLCYYFGKHEESGRALKSFRNIMGSLPAINHYIIQYTYFNGLNLLALAREKKKHKFRFAAKKAIKLVSCWAKDKNPNVPHKLLLLEAEYKSLKEKDSARIRGLYDKAIAMASRAGLLHDAAVANERAAIALDAMGDSFWSSSYLKQAFLLYRDWGAMAKAEHVLKRCGSAELNLSGAEFGSSGTVADSAQMSSLSTSRRRSSMSYKGVSRFDHAAADQHKRLT